MSALRALPSPTGPNPHPPRPPAAPLGDLRFSRLLGPDGWTVLPPAVRRRFGERVAAGASVTYTGRIVETRMSRVGRLLAQATRLIGAPLPLDRDGPDAGRPAVVVVTEDAASGGQNWTRIYARTRGFPQVVHSAKRFAGPTGLEEYVGRGVGMALALSVEDGALLFRSAHCFVTLFGRRLRLPRWLAPGRMTIGHRDLGRGRFAFTLDLVHPSLGELIHQTIIFDDPPQSVHGEP